MPKDYPEFKAWKKLERYCKQTKTKCYVNDVRSGLACAYCYIFLSRKNKKGPRSPVYISRWESICRRCYNKHRKKFLFTNIVAFFGFLIILLAIMLIRIRI